MRKTSPRMCVAITGSNGFLGLNLQSFLKSKSQLDIVLLPHFIQDDTLENLLSNVGIVFHFAGVNRPKDSSEYLRGNLGFTTQLCRVMSGMPNPPRVIYASSIHAVKSDLYGQSKLAAENELFLYSKKTGARVHVFRLANVFGKWSQPNYNSVVATFCHSIARNEPISIVDQKAILQLVYIDDVLSAFYELLMDEVTPSGFRLVDPEYTCNVGELADLIYSFRRSRETLIIERVGSGLVRALYATYLSFLPIDQFEYSLPCYEDSRGVFVEMLKTYDSGQISYFSAHPGVTRGEHYHHTKTEKFLVIQGDAVFNFHNTITHQLHSILVKGGNGKIIESIPGWAHNITNVGASQLLVLIWANEIFDPDRPDTYPMKVLPV